MPKTDWVGWHEDVEMEDIKVRYAARPVTKAVSKAATNIRRKTGRGIEKVGKRIIPEDFIHEAEKGKKEIKKEIDYLFIY